MKIYNCTLPWVNDERYDVCPIIDKNRNHSYQDIVQKWFKIYSYNSWNTTCPQIPKCKRSLYKMAIYADQGIPHSSFGSTLIIEMESTNVQSIVDSVAYDFQSLIGEVGGTLGLFLGLSTFSFVQFFEYIIRKIIPTK